MVVVGVTAVEEVWVGSYVKVVVVSVRRQLLDPNA